MDKRTSINTKATGATKFSKIQNSTVSSSLTNTFMVIIIGISAIAWIIAFAGSIASSQAIDVFPKFTWWSLVFQLIVTIVFPILYFFDLVDQYHNLMMAILAISFIYTSNSTNNLVYFSQSATAAAATGFILLSMTNFLWMYILGSSPTVPYLPGINNFQNHLFQSQQNQFTNTQNYTNSTSNLHNNYNYNDNDNDAYSNMEDAHELAGFENPVATSPSEFNDSAFRKSTSQNLMQSIDPEGTNFTGISSISQYIEAYPIVVRALYEYEASPDDVNELSFSKGEILRVKNTNDNWWQGKNKKGEIGMCPSNYLEVISS